MIQLFSKSWSGSKGEALGRFPQKAKPFCLPKIRTGRNQCFALLLSSPVDCLLVGDPIRGSPEGRSMAALFYSCEVPSVLSISPSVSFADSSLIRRSLLYISQILPNSILFKGNLKAYCKKHFLEYTTCINFKYTK